MPASQQYFDLRNLAAATCDSRNLLQSLAGNFVKRPPVAIEYGLLPGVLLPAADNNVDVLRVELNAVTDAPRLLGGNQRGSTSEEAIVNRLARQCVVEN